MSRAESNVAHMHSTGLLVQRASSGKSWRPRRLNDRRWAETKQRSMSHRLNSRLWVKRTSARSQAAVASSYLPVLSSQGDFSDNHLEPPPLLPFHPAVSCGSRPFSPSPLNPSRCLETDWPTCACVAIPCFMSRLGLPPGPRLTVFSRTASAALSSSCPSSRRICYTQPAGGQQDTYNQIPSPGP